VDIFTTSKHNPRQGERSKIRLDAEPVCIAGRIAKRGIVVVSGTLSAHSTGVWPCPSIHQPATSANPPIHAPSTSPAADGCESHCFHASWLGKPPPATSCAESRSKFRERLQSGSMWHLS